MTPWFNRLKNEENKNYYDFLENVGPYESNIKLHVHHIIPRFCFDFFLQESYKQTNLVEYRDSPANLIRLSLKDHIKAHQLLYEIYGDKRDASAVKLLTGQTSDAVKLWRQAGAEATHKLLKAKGSHFWSPEFQKIQVAKSLQKENALQSRSEGGKKGGRKRNINIAIKKDDRYLFFFKEKEYLCIFNCETGGDIVRILNKAIFTNLKRVTPLLKRQRKSLYGWSCEKL
uniref:Putative HNH homing endonuclease n=1 Tax=Jenufa perforata TaxID=993091 RepID=A0A0S2LND2_9CHLO|nr:putative HNH homing endonuclease [Jenufa perforata]ALO62927.1 putative HNH homing endonuclease [Jenufa perforata]